MPLPTDRISAKTAGYLRARERAVAIGDANLVRTINADLSRIGYREPELETAEAPGMPEAAVPPETPRRKPGRPPKVRTEV